MLNPRVYSAIGFIATCLIIFATFHHSMGSPELGRPYARRSLVELFQNEHGAWTWNWHYAPMLAAAIVLAALLYLIATTTGGRAWRGRLLIAATGLMLFATRHSRVETLYVALTIGVGLAVGALLIPRRERTYTVWVLLAVAFSLLLAFLAWPESQDVLRRHHEHGYQSHAKVAYAQYTAPPAEVNQDGTEAPGAFLQRLWLTGMQSPVLVAALLVLLLLCSFVGLEGRATRWIAGIAMMGLVVVTAAIHFYAHHIALAEGERSLNATEHAFSSVATFWHLRGTAFIPGLAAAVLLLAPGPKAPAAGRESPPDA